MGALLNVFGMTQLSATVEGTYANRSVDAVRGDVAVATSVSGTAWLIAGTTLMAVGGVALTGAPRPRLSAAVSSKAHSRLHVRTYGQLTLWPCDARLAIDVDPAASVVR